MRKKMDCICFIVSISSFLMMSVSLLFMSSETPNIVAGIGFWGFLLLGIAMQMVLSVRRKKALFALTGNKRAARKGRVGVLRVWQNVPAIIVDILFVLSFIGLVIAIWQTYGISYICYILLTINVFTFCLHCIFNGKIYEYITKTTNREGN